MSILKTHVRDHVGNKDGENKTVDSSTNYSNTNNNDNDDSNDGDNNNKESKESKEKKNVAKKLFGFFKKRSDKSE